MWYDVAVCTAPGCPFEASMPIWPGMSAEVKDGNVTALAQRGETHVAAHVSGVGADRHRVEMKQMIW